MPVDERMRVQAMLILENLEGAAAYPAPGEWDAVDDIEYLYREYEILTREQDAGRVQDVVALILDEAGYEGEITRERVSAGVVGIVVPGSPLLVPELLELLDGVLGRGVATPNHVSFVTPYMCAVPEPIPEPPGSTPNPPPAGSSGPGGSTNPGGSTSSGGSAGSAVQEEIRLATPGAGREGEGVSIVVVDTGLIEDADAGHPWLDGVQGTPEITYTELHGEVVIAPYASHGTFVAGVARCVAPRATVYVERAFAVAGADYETGLLHSLERGLDLRPDMFVLPYATATRHDLPPLTFNDLLERRIRYQKGLVMLAAVGNDTSQRPMWPAAYREVISVGALAESGRERAYFSNYGKWVDVYAPGQGLINAFAVGTYVYFEPPRAGTSARFEGMAKWGGSSFAVPIVAGLVAARMSDTGENARQAADSVLGGALRQAIPGVGAVLYPDQAVSDRPGAS